VTPVLLLVGLYSHLRYVSRDLLAGERVDLRPSGVAAYAALACTYDAAGEDLYLEVAIQSSLLPAF
jgi:hypothetical protein